MSELGCAGLKMLYNIFGPSLLVLLVLIVPIIVPQRYVPTALGAHKSVSIAAFPEGSLLTLTFVLQIEQTGATISVTVAGYLLDIRNSSNSDSKPSSSRSDPSDQVEVNVRGRLPTPEAIFRLLCWFAVFNILQAICIYFLWTIDSAQQIPNEAETPSYKPLTSEEPESLEDDSGKAADSEEGAELSDEDDDPNGRASPNSYSMRRTPMHSDEPLIGLPDQQQLGTQFRPRQGGARDALDVTPSEYFRGKAFYIIFGTMIIGAWTFYVISLVSDFQQ